MAVRDHTVVVCDGEWDISRADEFARLCADALAADAEVLIFDFRAATFVEASTIGALGALSRAASRRRAAVAVVASPGLVGRIFELCHLAKMLPVAAGVEAAAAAARRQLPSAPDR